MTQWGVGVGLHGPRRLVLLSLSWSYSLSLTHTHTLSLSLWSYSLSLSLSLSLVLLSLSLHTAGPTLSPNHESRPYSLAAYHAPVGGSC